MSHESDEFLSRVMSNVDGEAERRGYLRGLEEAAKVADKYQYPSGKLIAEEIRAKMT